MRLTDLQREYLAYMSLISRQRDNCLQKYREGLTTEPPMRVPLDTSRSSHLCCLAPDDVVGWDCGTSCDTEADFCGASPRFAGVDFRGRLGVLAAAGACCWRFDALEEEELFFGTCGRAAAATLTKAFLFASSMRSSSAL